MTDCEESFLLLSELVNKRYSERELYDPLDTGESDTYCISCDWFIRAQQLLERQTISLLHGHTPVNMIRARKYVND